MFGYINANLRELSEAQKNIYHSYYCGLCRKLKEQSGKKGQMLLNYDMTFLILLLTGLYEPGEQEKIFTCALHPFHKKRAMSSEITEYAAKMNVLLSYQNFADDWQDDRSMSKKVLMKLFSKEYHNIKKEYPRQGKAVESYMVKLAVAESGREENLDAVAGLTGDMLGEIFAWKEDEWKEELRSLGFYMGKFIYLMDAFEDIEDDEKKGLYNPFTGYRETAREKDFDTYVKLILTSMMSECAKSFERLPIILHGDLLRNILYSGVWTKYEYCRAKREKSHKENKQERR